MIIYTPGASIKNITTFIHVDTGSYVNHLAKYVPNLQLLLNDSTPANHALTIKVKII